MVRWLGGLGGSKVPGQQLYASEHLLRVTIELHVLVHTYTNKYNVYTLANISCCNSLLGR